MSMISTLAQVTDAGDLQNIEAAGSAGFAYGLAAIGPGIGIGYLVRSRRRCSSALHSPKPSH